VYLLVAFATASRSLIPEVEATVNAREAVALRANLTMVDDVAKPDEGTFTR
jgi:hypothetical protein